MKNVKIPVLLLIVAATILILLDYYLFTPGRFGWLSHLAFWPVLAIVVVVVYFAFRNESLNEKARRNCTLCMSLLITSGIAGVQL